MKKAKSRPAQKKVGRTPTKPVDAKNGGVADWRSQLLKQIRDLIKQVDPDIEEEIKWIKPSNPSGVPVWMHNGIICTGESYKTTVKLTFPKGASLDDPSGLFNSSLEGNARRAIDFHEGDKINQKALKSLIRAAIRLNRADTVSRANGKKSTKSPVGSAEAPTKPRLLSGGNPQIAKADGNAPVQEYIAAMPGWKQRIGKRLDTLIEQNVPGVVKGVRWNSPMYGIEGNGWFLTFHCLTKYVKVTFFNGRSLRPIPPGGTPKSKEARWLDIFEDDEFDEVQFTDWVKQSAALPGWNA